MIEFALTFLVAAYAGWLCGGKWNAASRAHYIQVSSLAGWLKNWLKERGKR